LISTRGKHDWIGRTMKHSTGEDRRIIRTKSALNRAFLELVKEKGYESVTIEEITSRANIGRTTFYLHYQDKEDLLLEGLEEQLTTLVNEIIQRPLALWFQENNGKLIKWIFQTLFEAVKENSDIFRLITREQSNKVYDRFRKIITNATLKILNENPWIQKKRNNVAVPISYLTDYFSGAMWSSIVWWAANDFTPSADEMADSFRLLFFPGMLRALNVKDVSGLLEPLDSAAL